MKKILMILVIAAVAAGSAFAWGNGNNRTFPAASQSEDGTVLVTLSGVIALEDGRLVLSSDGETYSMGGPGTALQVDNFSEGDEVLVEGLLYDECDDSCEDDHDGHIRVAKITMDGEDYLFAPAGNGEGRRMNRLSDNGRGQGYNSGTYGRQSRRI